MFAVRGIVISFSIFFLLYAALSLAVFSLWRRVWLSARRYSARSCADLLFALRVAPFGVAISLTLALAVPSFLLLEPRAVNEPMGIVSLALSLCGMIGMLAGVVRAAGALVRASKTVARWSRPARVIGYRTVGCGDSIPVLRTSAAAPPLTTVGVFRCSVWLSRAAELSLTAEELQRALCHELAHVRRRDNLRKLILRLIGFPGMAELETAWREATEMAADDAAVSNACEALDLAAALIKLSRLAPLMPAADLTTALIHSPAASVSARVQRLVTWTDRPHDPAERYFFGYAWAASGAMLAILFLTHTGMLVQVHAATEWLVR